MAQTTRELIPGFTLTRRTVFGGAIRFRISAHCFDLTAFKVRELIDALHADPEFSPELLDVPLPAACAPVGLSAPNLGGLKLGLLYAHTPDEAPRVLECGADPLREWADQHERGHHVFGYVLLPSMGALAELLDAGRA